MKVSKTQKWILAGPLLAVCIFFSASDVIVSYKFLTERQDNLPWFILFTAFVLGVAFLIYKDKVKQKTQLLHATILSGVFAVVLTVMPIWITVNTAAFFLEDPQFIRENMTYMWAILIPLVPLIFGIWLWIETIRLKRKYRTLGCR